MEEKMSIDNPQNVRNAVDFFNSLTRKKTDPNSKLINNKRESNKPNVIIAKQNFRPENKEFQRSEEVIEHDERITLIKTTKMEQQHVLESHNRHKHIINCNRKVKDVIDNDEIQSATVAIAAGIVYQCRNDDRKKLLLSDDSEMEERPKVKQKRYSNKYFSNTVINERFTSSLDDNNESGLGKKSSSTQVDICEGKTVTILYSCLDKKNREENDQVPLLLESDKECDNQVHLDFINCEKYQNDEVKVITDRNNVGENNKETNDELSTFRNTKNKCESRNFESKTNVCILSKYQNENRNLPDVALKTSPCQSKEIDKEYVMNKQKLRRRASSPKAFYRKTSISEYLNNNRQQRISDFLPEKDIALPALITSQNLNVNNNQVLDVKFFQVNEGGKVECGVNEINFININNNNKSRCKKKPEVPLRIMKNRAVSGQQLINREEVEKSKRITPDYAGLRSDVFLEPYLQGLGERQNGPSGGGGGDDPSISPPPCRIAPCLLPTPASRSLSRESLISSNGGGSDAGSEESTDTGYGATCDINLVERLIRSHPIWFLPGIQRAGAFHLLQGKEEGCFVVRQSSQPDTMALSVRLPPDKGPYIEHYLIQSSEGRLGLETSENRFDNMPALIAHYANCCDELPVQLTLPKAIREAKSRQQLSSLALLGQEFWRYSPPPSASSSPDVDLVLNPLLSTFKKTESSASPEDVQRPVRPSTLNLISNIETNQKTESNLVKSTPLSGKNESTKIPPPPPPRWSKPTTPQSNFGTPQNNFTVTTTVTFSVKSDSSPKSELPPSQMDVVCDPKRMSPEGQCHSAASSKDSSLRRGPDQIVSPNDSVLSPLSDPSSILSPDTLSPLSITKTGRHSKRSKHKLSKHYQESDILDSPTIYYRSAVGDKVSDYEDLWTNDHSTFKPKNNSNNNSNINHSNNLPSPDLLQHTQNVVSLNNNILSPTDSHSGSQRSHCSTPVVNTSQNSQISIQSTLGETPKNPELRDATSNNFHPPKQNSPFYAEPADSLTSVAVTRRFLGRNLLPMQQRHSNPPALHLHSALSPGLERIDSPELNGTISSSVGNLSPKQKPIPFRKPEVKAIQPPLIKPKVSDNWTLDNSWKFMVSETDMMELSDGDYDSDWPSGPPQLLLSPHTCDSDDRITVQDLIARRFPDIRTSTEITLDEDMSRMSAYDNVDDKIIPRAPPSEISELTEFSDPWNEVNQGIVCTETDDTLSENFNPPSRGNSIMGSKCFKERMDPLLAAPRLQALRNREQGYNSIGNTIRQYALELATDKSTTFAQNIDNFIACTCESKEINPQVVMRNMRQFMSGMKNYLVKHGEKGFDKEVEKERHKLKSTEFLNLDAILEGVMHKLVVKPLKGHIQKLFVDYYTKTGAIRLLAENIQFASTRPISELAVKPKISLPSETALQTISQYLNRLQAADSPLEKLEYLLASIATIFNSVKTNQLSGSGRAITLGADDFLPLFVWVLVKTNFVAAEIEAEYMWGLLHPSLLSGEGGYYLTTLSSAVHVLKNFKEIGDKNPKNNIKNDSVLKVIVPDELHGSILTKTLPARPHMTTKEVCKIIAHKARITNPQDYALYRLVDGEENILGDNECPQDFMNDGRHVRLAYKRIDAKIAWPKQQSN